jgi:hypothetical protein
MTNYILSGNTTINGTLTVSGTMYNATTEESLQKIENLSSYENLSGTFDDLNIDGNFVFCSFKNHELIVNGSTCVFTTQEL